MTERSDQTMPTREKEQAAMGSQQSGAEGLSTADLASASTEHDPTTSVEPDGVDTPETQVESRPRTQPETAPSATTPLFSEDEAGSFRSRWDSIQSGFVDQPRQAVEQADRLVADIMKRLAESFAEERSTLECQWQRGEDISTEDLRVALQRYRSFFDRLLSV